MSRPHVFNAISADVLNRLLDVLRALRDDNTVRVVVFRGSGERAFASGDDINEFVRTSPFDVLAIAARLRAVTDITTSIPNPITASIAGYCLGGGFELALVCDIRIAADTAHFGLPEIKLGMQLAGAGTVRLTKLAGSSSHVCYR
ncbi:enoyl-CoA hydratase/isomerase family protein [Bradyrhizobium betae]|nr:enoyl-CoA hydratase/isomerase family protein [Bradyrhizobium betae]